MFGSIGMPELIIGLVVILLLFGAKRVPELARGLGSGVREFKKGQQEGQVEKKEEEQEDEQLEASKNGHDDEARLEDDSPAEKAEQQQHSS
ncbi:MAG TPA: twin-arginine translocase TatA/TatE family subunit [Rubrobacter sp.]|nr:twin-arginine translocase TatA/TatE family subunit [Rubrobacter sp.]